MLDVLRVPHAEGIGMLPKDFEQVLSVEMWCCTVFAVLLCMVVPSPCSVWYLVQMSYSTCVSPTGYGCAHQIPFEFWFLYMLGAIYCKLLGCLILDTSPYFHCVGCFAQQKQISSKSVIVCALWNCSYFCSRPISNVIVSSFIYNKIIPTQRVKCCWLVLSLVFVRFSFKF